MRQIQSFIGVALFASGFAVLNAGLGSLLFFALNLLGGVLIAIVLVWVLPKTQLRRPDLIGVTWLALYVIQMFNNIIEGYFFTDIFPSFSSLGSAMLFSLFPTLVEAVMAGVLFLPEKADRSIVSQLRDYFKKRTKASWAWRIAVASIAYLPVYFTFGALISPFVIPYYSDPSLGLKIPSLTVIIPLEILRGFFFVAALLPIMASINKDRRTLSAIIASLLYVPGALVPLMLGTALPANIVPIHLVEILGDSIVYGTIIAYLLGRDHSPS